MKMMSPRAVFMKVVVENLRNKYLQYNRYISTITNNKDKLDNMDRLISKLNHSKSKIELSSDFEIIKS